MTIFKFPNGSLQLGVLLGIYAKLNSQIIFEISWKKLGLSVWNSSYFKTNSFFSKYSAMQKKQHNSLK